MDEKKYKGTVNCTVTEKVSPGKFEDCGVPAIVYCPVTKDYYCEGHTTYALVAGFKIEPLPEMPESLKILMEAT